MSNLLILLGVEILLFCVCFVFTQQDIMAPSIMMLLVFIFSTLITLLNVEKWKIKYSVEAMLILVLGLFLFCAIDILTKACFKSRQKSLISGENRIIEIDNWKTGFIIFCDIIIVFLVYREVRRIAGTNAYFTNIFYAYRVITSHSSERGLDQYMNGVVAQAMKIVIVSGFIYAFTFVNNVLVNKKKIRKNILYLVPPALLIVMTLITGVRTNVLRLAVFVLIVWYVLLQMKQGWRIKTSWKFVRKLALSVVIILILFTGLQTFLGRTGETDFLSVISNYAGASIQHFNQYIQDPPEPNKVFGQETFTGVWNVLNKLGIVKKSFLAHEEYRYLDNVNFGNVYTFFRRYLQDFGAFGMAIMTIITSFIFSYMYNCKICGKKLTYRRMLTIIEYGYMYYIVAMSSVDNIVHDYLNVGIIIQILLLHAMMWFLFKCKIKYKERICSK